ncbi:MAG TPA: hypothetical protein VF163_11835 [Micromonosporaceae bacterium]
MNAVAVSVAVADPVAWAGVAQRVERFADLADTVLARPARLGPVRLVAVDGHAGSGKTTFGHRLASALTACGVAIAEIHTDDLLDGWSDLVTFWPRLQEWVLDPLRAGTPGRYRRYDWHRGCFDPAWHSVAVPDVLLLEGVSSARAAIAAEVTLSVFVVAPAELRLARAITRDGPEILVDFARWMAAEERHYMSDATVSRADLVVDGAPWHPHDRRHEYVRLV